MINNGGRQFPGVCQLPQGQTRYDASTAEHRKIYQLKLVLRGISPQIWRRVLVDADTSLADLLTAFGSHFPLDQRGLEGLGSNRRKLPVEQH